MHLQGEGKRLHGHGLGSRGGGGGKVDLPGQHVDLARLRSLALLRPWVVIVLVDDAGKMTVARSLHGGQG